MSEVWPSLGSELVTQTPRLLSGMQGEETNQNRRLSCVAGKLRRGHDYTDNRRGQASSNRQTQMRSLRLREPRPQRGIK